MTFAWTSQFHVYLPWGQRPFSIVSFNSVLNVFQPGEGPSRGRGLLHDCKIFAYLRITFVLSSTGCCCEICFGVNCVPDKKPKTIKHLLSDCILPSGGRHGYANYWKISWNQIAFHIYSKQTPNIG